VLNGAVKSLQDAGKFNNSVGSLGSRLASIAIELADVCAEIAQIETGFEPDPERLSFLQNRLDLLYRLQQKHKVSSCKELVELYDKLETELSVVYNIEAHIAELEDAVAIAEDRLKEVSGALRANREKIIPEIEKNIVILLRSLGMPNAVVEIVIDDSPSYSATGSDSVAFLFSGNRNMPLRPIAETASGGEVSRIMLCLKSMLASSKQLPTIIFDEIDVGISGDVAEKMGYIMREMSLQMQVIAITHLPQIASKGKHHYAVNKKDTANSTKTEIALLSEQERVYEVAKMLSGKELTEAALQNASHLLKS